MKAAIIGGGAAGLTAAIFAARTDPNAEITVFEGNSRVGKKLLSTGNGRCNLTNAGVSVKGYTTHEPKLLGIALDGHGPGFVRNFFAGLGIPLTAEEDRLYPRSMRANSVADALRFECDRRKIKTVTDTKIGEIGLGGEGFTVKGAVFDRLCLACGGKAAPALGSDGGGFALAEGFGHKVYDPYPSLVRLKTETGERDLKGLRVRARARAVVRGETLREEVGEVQFSDSGLSGIPIMQLSSLFQGNMEIFLDLLPELDFAAALDGLLGLADAIGDLPLPEFMGGYFHKALTRRVCRRCGLSADLPVNGMTVNDMKSFVRAAKSMEFRIVGTDSWANAQTTRGGVDLRETDPRTMESRLAPGLYFAGEILDVCGDCGGFNLHWAWVSGARAGESMVKR